jgi:hypothetical protein
VNVICDVITYIQNILNGVYMQYLKSKYDAAWRALTSHLRTDTSSSPIPSLSAVTLSKVTNVTKAFLAAHNWPSSPSPSLLSSTPSSGGGGSMGGGSGVNAPPSAPQSTLRQNAGIMGGYVKDIVAGSFKSGKKLLGIESKEKQEGEKDKEKKKEERNNLLSGTTLTALGKKGGVLSHSSPSSPSSPTHSPPHSPVLLPSPSTHNSLLSTTLSTVSSLFSGSPTCACTMIGPVGSVEFCVCLNNIEVTIEYVHILRKKIEDEEMMMNDKQKEKLTVSLYQWDDFLRQFQAWSSVCCFCLLVYYYY